jgi:putative hydrolase of the HAD superfamily
MIENYSIKHISFDLWMTLIRSNSVFRKKRAEFIAETFNPKNMNIAEIEQSIIDCDKEFDKYSEIEHKKIPAKKMFRTALEKMKVSKSENIEQDAEYLLNTSNKLFLEFPPHFLNDRIPKMLSELKMSGFTLSIGSNTGFAEGVILRRLFQKLDILKYFSFLVFSDEIKISKPSAKFFQYILDNTTLSKAEILHVGDNPMADYKGSMDFGFKSLLITNQNYSTDDIRAAI